MRESQLSPLHSSFLIGPTVFRIWRRSWLPLALNSPLFRNVTMPSVRIVIAWHKR